MHVGAGAGGDIIRDGGHLLDFLLHSLPLTVLSLEMVSCGLWSARTSVPCALLRRVGRARERGDDAYTAWLDLAAPTHVVLCRIQHRRGRLLLLALRLGRRGGWRRRTGRRRSHLLLLLLGGGEGRGVGAGRTAQSTRQQRGSMWRRRHALGFVERGEEPGGCRC